jgi:hypothetical protein
MFEKFCKVKFGQNGSIAAPGSFLKAATAFIHPNFRESLKSRRAPLSK